MPQYIYDGPGLRLVIGGQTMVRGRSIQLEGLAAEAAARHPEVHLAGAQPAGQHSAPEWGSTVKEAMAWVGDDRDRAAQVLEAEKARGDDARTSLISHLEGLLADNGGGEQQ